MKNMRENVWLAATVLTEFLQKAVGPATAIELFTDGSGVIRKDNGEGKGEWPDVNNFYDLKDFRENVVPLYVSPYAIVHSELAPSAGGASLHHSHKPTSQKSLVDSLLEPLRDRNLSVIDYATEAVHYALDYEIPAHRRSEFVRDYVQRQLELRG